MRTWPAAWQSTVSTSLVIGVSFDGTGYGTDGAIWGGEFLLAYYRHFRRAAHLRYVGLPGGDSAVREPWRTAAAHLLDASCPWDALGGRIDRTKTRTIATMLQRRVNTPLTSSAGRLFDAVASLAGVRDAVSYEGQAAIELEWLATGVTCDGTYPFQITRGDSSGKAEPVPDEIDTRPLIRAVVSDVQNGTSQRRIARRFHSTIVDIIGSSCAAIREQTGLDAVVLSGGVFMNALVASESAARLSADGFRVYRHVLVPPNDGGICLGQLAIGAAVSHSSKASELHAPRRSSSRDHSQKTLGSDGSSSGEPRRQPSTVPSQAAELRVPSQPAYPNARQEG